MIKITHLTKENYKEELSKKGISFVAFWAPWCGPCRMMAPVYEQVAEEMEKVNVYKVNTDENQEIAFEYSVRSLPTLLFIKDGSIIETLIGANSKSAIIDKLNSIL